ncbi:MAG: WD40 repeat domain-containing protein [Candidatus Omnitrophica bacterium]|nr:WD40 repeat domain-containing protein [Candidatus Omnitrophota bacterium]
MATHHSSAPRRQRRRGFSLGLLQIACLSVFILPSHAQAAEFVVSPNDLPVLEGGTQTLRIWLSEEPDTDVTATVARVSGDTDLSILSGSPLLIPKAQWQTAVPVVISATEDGDSTSGTALLRIQETSANGIPPRGITAIELDNDNTISVGGVLTQDTIWDDPSRNYLLTSAVTVPATYSLRIGPYVMVRHDEGHHAGIVVEGTLEAMSGSTILLRTNAHWDANDRKNGITVKTGGVADFEDCRILAREASNRWSQGTGEWAHLVRAEEGATITLDGCALESLNTTSDYRTGYGLAIGNATASLIGPITSTNTFRGFRVALHQTFGSAEQRVDKCEFENNEERHLLTGNLVHDITLSNSGMRIDGTLTVQSGATLRLTPDSELYRWEGRHFIVDGGVLVLDRGRFGATTTNHYDPNSKRHGIVFRNGAEGVFEEGTLFSDEARETGSVNEWAALIHADASSRITLRGTSFLSRKPSGRRTGYALFLDGAGVTSEDSGGTPVSIAGFHCGIHQVFGSALQSIAPCQFQDCETNHWIQGDAVRDAEITNVGMGVYGGVTVHAGARLALTPGSTLYRGFGAPLIVDGGELTATDATFGAETQNHYDPNSRRPGITFRNGARGQFENCELFADELRHVDSNSEWCPLLYCDDSSELNVAGCRLQSRNSGGRRTGYGIQIAGGTGTITALGAIPTSFEGFRCGFYIGFGPGSFDITGCTFTGTDYQGALAGDISHSLTLKSENEHHLFGNVTVKSGAIVDVVPGCSLNTNGRTFAVETNGSIAFEQNDLRINAPLQVSGSLEADGCRFVIGTSSHYYPPDRRCGVNLLAGGQGLFENSCFISEESRQTGSEGDWAAMIYSAADSSLTCRNCSFAPRDSYDPFTRYVIRSWNQRSLEIEGCTFSGNPVALRLDAVPTGSFAHDSNFVGNGLAVENATQVTFDATRNWWGSPTGPRHTTNPGGMGDPISDYVDYGQSALNPTGTWINLIDPISGQEPNNLTTAATQTSVEILGLRVQPPQSQIAGLGFRLFDPVGLDWTQFANLLLVMDANGDGSASVAERATALTPSSLSSSASELLVGFDQELTTPLNPSAGYILVGDLHSVAPGDAFRAELFRGWLCGAEGTPVQSDVSPVRHYAGDAISLADPGPGQLGDNLSGMSRQNNVILYGFRLLGQSAQALAAELTLSNVQGINRSHFTATSLYHDLNGNAQVDAADPRLGSATEIVIDRANGHISFAGPLDANQTYLVAASFRGLPDSGQFTIQLEPENVQAAGAVVVTGYARKATHVVDLPYLIAQSNTWSPPQTFGQVINQPDFVALGFRILPLGRTVGEIHVPLTSVVGIKAADILNPRLVWDKNANGALDGGDEVLSSGGSVEINGNQGLIHLTSPFITRGHILLAADFASLANGDEITVSLSPEDVVVPEGFRVTGAAPPIRYVVNQGIVDSRSPNMNWSLTYRSPGGRTVMARYNNAGDKVILGYDTGSAWVYEASSNTPLLMLKEHYDKVEYAGFSSDDSAAITVTRDGAVYIWDLGTGSQRSAMFSDLLVSYGAPSPDFSKLMVITEGKGILLDVDLQQRLWEFQPGDASVNAIAYSPDGQYILIGTSDKRAYLLDAETGVETRRFVGHTQAVTAVSFTGDGSRLMTGSTDATVQLWETDNGRPLGGPPLLTISLQGQQSQGAAVSPSGNRVAMVTGSGNGAQLRMFDQNGLELYAVNLWDESGGNWGGSLETLAFDTLGERVLVSSRDSDWARIASFRVTNGDYLLSWGPSGRFTHRLDARPRISMEGDRVFFMGDWGLNVLPRALGKKILRASGIPGDRGYDISADGSKVARFTHEGRLKVDSVSDEDVVNILDRAVGVNYNSVTSSSAGDLAATGDRLFNTQTGYLFSNYAITDREAFSAFSPDSLLWGFTVPQDKALVTCRVDDPGAVLYNLMLTDPYTPYKMLYHPDGARVGCVDSGVGVQMYDMTTDLPVGLYRFPNNADAALSEDGTLLLIGGRNTVRLYEIATGRVLRYFYPQHSSLQDVDVRALQFARHDTLILIAWSYNYIETYERSLPDHIEITPGTRVLAAGESQDYQVTVVYDDDSRVDVTPSSAPDRSAATLETDPPLAATVDGNLVTVNPGAARIIVVRALYRESGSSLTAEAAITVGESHLTELVADPAHMSVVPGVFRNISYRARYDDGYERDVTSQVFLEAAQPLDVAIAGQSAKIELTAPPGDYLVLGRYTAPSGDTASATSTLTSFGLRTEWDRYRVTGGGYGLSGAWNPSKNRLAWGSSSGVVNLYEVGVTPSQYALERLITAHDGPVIFTDYLSDTSLLTVSEEGTIKVWDLVGAATEPVTTYHHSAPILTAARSGAKVAFGDSLGQVGLYDLSLDNLDWIHALHTGNVLTVAVDSTWVLSGGQDERAKVLQRSDGALLRSILTHTGPIVAVGFLGANAFYTVSRDQTASLWRRSDFQILERFEYPVPPSAAEVIGSELYVATENPVATWVYNTDGLLLRWLEHPPNAGVIVKMLVDPTGKYLLTGRRTTLSQQVVSGGIPGLSETEERPSPFSSFQFWETGRGIFRGWLAHSHPLENASVSADALKVFTQDQKRTIKWSFDVSEVTTEARSLLETGYFLDHSFAGMDFTADSSILATRVGVSIYLYNTFQDLLWKTLHTPGAGPFAISPSGVRLASSDSKVRLWDLANLSQIREEDRVASALDFRFDNQFLAGIRADNFIGIWNENGLLFNGMQTQHPPVRVFVNSTGTRCAAITVEVRCNLFSCTYTYYLEVFDISNVAVEPPAVGAPLFLIQTSRDLFGGGEGEIRTEVAISDDTALALIGAEGDRPVRLISTADGSTLREFFPPSGGSALNLGAATVGFADNDGTLMIGWREGFVELFRRIPPSRLSVVVTRAPSNKGDLPDKVVVVDGGSLYALPGESLSTETIAEYANGAELNVTSVAELRSDNPQVATVEGRMIQIPSGAQTGAQAHVTILYQELGTGVQAVVQVIVGEDPQTLGDTTGDLESNYLDLFEFSRWWKNDAGAGGACDKVEDGKVDQFDLLYLMGYWIE